MGNGVLWKKAHDWVLWHEEQFVPKAVWFALALLAWVNWAW
jgi:hypothetical protein